MELNFNADSVPERSFLQVGWHPTMIESAQPKTSKQNADNGYLEVTFQITEGPSQGARAWARFNLWNVNPQAVEIAHQEFAELLRAVGRPQLGRTEELNGLQAMVQVVEQKGRSDMTEIKRYAPLAQKATLMAGGAGNSAPVGIAPPTTTPTTPPPPATSTPAPAPLPASPPAPSQPPQAAPASNAFPQAAPSAMPAPAPSSAPSTGAPWER